jgi:TetR/AcrR family transcriptional repressor of nem operon
VKIVGMRYKKGRTEITRRRIIATALKKFREKGIHAAGLKDLLASAGVKQGSFYNYFASKEQLVQEALVDALERRRDACADAFGKDGSGIEAEVRRYLSPGCRDNLGEGGTMAAVAPEIARQPESTRRAVEQRLN